MSPRVELHQDPVTSEVIVKMKDDQTSVDLFKGTRDQAEAYQAGIAKGIQIGVKLAGGEVWKTAVQ